MPPKAYTKLVFSDLRTYSTGHAVQSHTYRLNDLFDPAITGLSGASLPQPRGLDQMAKFYRRYLVNAAKIHSICHNGSTYAVRCNQISAAGQQAITGDIHKDPEQPFSKSIVLGSTGAKTVGHMTQYHKMKSIYGDPEYDPSDYGASVTATPSKLVFSTVSTGAFNAGSGADKNVQIVTEIIFYVMFYDLRPLTVSTGADEPV